MALRISLTLSIPQILQKKAKERETTKNYFTPSLKWLQIGGISESDPETLKNTFYYILD